VSLLSSPSLFSLLPSLFSLLASYYYLRDRWTSLNGLSVGSTHTPRSEFPCSLAFLILSTPTPPPDLPSYYLLSSHTCSPIIPSLPRSHSPSSHTRSARPAFTLATLGQLSHSLRSCSSNANNQYRTSIRNPSSPHQSRYLQRRRRLLRNQRSIRFSSSHVDSASPPSLREGKPSRRSYRPWSPTWMYRC